jgi:hypothetical protein
MTPPTVKRLTSLPAKLHRQAAKFAKEGKSFTAKDAKDAMDSITGTKAVLHIFMCLRVLGGEASSRA